MSIDFFQTKMGRIFFEGTMPRLVQNIDKLTSAVDKLAAQKEEATIVIEIYNGVIQAVTTTSKTKVLVLSTEGKEKVPCEIHAIDAKIDKDKINTILNSIASK